MASPSEGSLGCGLLYDYNVKSLPVPANTAGQIGRSVGPLLLKRAFDTPVMGQVYGFPVGLIDRWFVAIGHIAFMKRPALIE